MGSPVGPLFVEVAQVLERALGIFERLGDRTGVMSTVIAMAYARYGPVMHLSSSARHLEEIRRVTSRLSELVTESERDRLDLQMLFGVHVYSRAKVVPDLALSRGEDAYRAARLQGDRAIEFLAAGGVAMTLLDLGDVEGAERWLGLAAAAASMALSRGRSIQLETWRGMVRARAGDAAGMRGHLEKAVAMATEGGRASARCEALARIAVEAARLVAREAQGRCRPTRISSISSSDRRPRSRRCCRSCPVTRRGARRPMPRSRRSLSHAAIPPRAAIAGGAAFEALQAGHHEDASLEIIVPAARGVFAGAPPEVQGSVRDFLRATLSRIAQGTADESIRVRWLTGPIGRELVELAGPLDVPDAPSEAAGPRPRPRRDGTPTAAAPDRGSDERGDRRRARHGRSGRRPSPGAPVRPARHLQPRRGDLARLPRARRRGVRLMAIRARVDRHKCIGAGNCITLAPTAFDWLAGDYGKSDVVGADSVDEEVLRAAAFACPTAAVVLEDVSELLPWQLRGKSGPDPSRHEDLHVHRHRRFDEPRRGARRRGVGGDPRAGTTRPSVRSSRPTTARRSPRPATGSSSASTRRTSRWRRRSRSSGASRSIARRRASRPRSGSVSTPPTRHGSAATSTARASTRRPGSRHSAAPATSSPASRRSASRTGHPNPRSATLKGLSGPIEVVNVDWR